MTELIERVAFGGLNEQLKHKCPYCDPSEGADVEEDENVKEDDLPAAKHQQANDGGVLGKNMISGSPGKKGTVGGPFSAENREATPRVDTRRTRMYVNVPGTKQIATRGYGFTVAAHHLIPGEAALAKSVLVKFMTRGKSVDIEVVTPSGKKTKKKEVAKHIGYNVNGSHNGVWLPGNYYIRSSTSPVPQTTWSDLGDNPWCLNYVAAASKAANAQFHDTHEKYSEKVLALLNKIAARLMKHECDSCEGSKINPPFSIKTRLYGISAKLRCKVSGSPLTWDRNWLTSDRWSTEIFHGTKRNTNFTKTYMAASTYVRRR